MSIAPKAIQILSNGLKEIELVKQSNNPAEFYTKLFFLYNCGTSSDGTVTCDSNDPRLTKGLQDTKYITDLYNDYKQQIIRVKLNTRTLNKLKEQGIIEVIEVGGTYPDRIKITDKGKEMI